MPNASSILSAVLRSIRGHPVRVAVEGKQYGGVVSEVLGSIRMRARVSSIVKKLCHCWHHSDTTASATPCNTLQYGVEQAA